MLLAQFFRVSSRLSSRPVGGLTRSQLKSQTLISKGGPASAEYLFAPASCLLTSTCISKPYTPLVYRLRTKKKGTGVGNVSTAQKTKAQPSRLSGPRPVSQPNSPVVPRSRVPAQAALASCSGLLAPTRGLAVVVQCIGSCPSARNGHYLRYLSVPLAAGQCSVPRLAGPPFKEAR